MLTLILVLAIMVKVCPRCWMCYQTSLLLLWSKSWLLIHSVCLVLYPSSTANLFAVRREAIFPVYPGDVYPNETLLYHGYISCSPVQPTLAISLRTLAAYRQSHRACPRFSIEAQCKMLCHIHNVRKFPCPLILSLMFGSRYLMSLTWLHNFLWHMTHILISVDVPTIKSRLHSDSILRFPSSSKPAHVASTNKKMSRN